jgi:hypothetical protein
MFMTESLTVVRAGGYFTGILNINDEDVTLFLPILELEECKIENKTINLDTFVAQGCSDAGSPL